MPLAARQSARRVKNVARRRVALRGDAESERYAYDAAARRRVIRYVAAMKMRRCRERSDTR